LIQMATVEKPERVDSRFLCVDFERVMKYWAAE